jgi:hypothetical protein
LLSFEATGSSIERGTLPSAAWCSTSSAPRRRSRQVASERMSPSMKRKRFQRARPPRRGCAQVLALAGGEVVEADHLLLELQQVLGQVASR